MGAEQSSQQQELRNSPICGEILKNEVLRGDNEVTSISFKVNGEIHSVDVSEAHINSQTRLVDYIRGNALLKGTKYMCREGGCGACVVNVISKDAHSKGSVIKSANSCLIPLLSCDGWEINTIEKLGNKNTGYHQIQKEMIVRGGTQCGFCTPGMIMHMYSYIEAAKAAKIDLKPKDIEDSLDGNICRCTGYRPILDSFKSFATPNPPKPTMRDCDSGLDIEEAHRLCPLKSASEEYELVQTEETKIFKLPISNHSETESWIAVTTLHDAFSAINHFKKEKTNYRIIAGNTSTGIYKNDNLDATGFIDILNIPLLSATTLNAAEVILGSCITIASAINLFKQQSSVDGFTYLGGLCQHMKRIANHSVRNVGTLAGNLMIKHNHNEFPSDLFTILETVGALLKIATDANTATMYSVKDFIKLKMDHKLILSIHLKALKGNYVFRSYKVAKRYQNAHAIVNAGFLFNVDKTQSFLLTEKPSIVFGGIDPNFIHAEKTEISLTNTSLTSNDDLQTAMTMLSQEIQPEDGQLFESVQYRKLLTQSLLYKAILSIAGSGAKLEFQSGGRNIKRNVTFGVQTYQTDSTDWPINQPLPKLESAYQCSGEAVYINDINPEPNELFGVLVLSTQGNADISSIDPSDALKDLDVVKFIQASDIPGTNDYMVGSKGTPEEIFAKDKVACAGQPIGVLVAKNEAAAKKGAALVKVTYANIKKPSLTIKDALTPPTNGLGDFSISAQSSGIGDDPTPPPTPKSIKIQGEFEIGSQYHFQMETQISICKPIEGGMHVICATQWMDFTQDAVAGALNLPAHKVSVEVRRLGGAYGSKISRASHVAAACAVAAHVLNTPVRISLDLKTNMEAIGKRPPYLAQYEAEVEEDTGKIVTLKTHIVVNAGMHSNEETHSGASYYLQNCYDASKWTITGQTVNTNNASNTWCRAPGTTQGIAISEYIMEHIAHALGKDPLEVRKVNFAEATVNNNLMLSVRDLMRRGAIGYKKPDHLSFTTSDGTDEKDDPPAPTPPPPQQHILLKMIDEAKTNSSYDDRVKAVEEFNKVNRWKKRGLALLPMKYPLSYGGGGFPIFISIYKYDATVAISYGGIECGQGINTKVVQTVAKEFGIGIDKIVVWPANNLIGVNADTTGGSSTSELCCYAASMACQILIKRMKSVKDKLKKDPTWEELIKICARVGLDLSASYMYSKNDPVVPYNIWAVNITEVEIDCLTGEHKIARVDLLEDCGKSLNPEIDVGQIEGALMMGLGFWTIEKLIYDTATGQLLTNGTWEYKPPEPKNIPEDLRITLLKDAPNPLGVLRSKATGEPATCSSVCVLFAIRNAIQAARKDAGNTDWFQINGPITSEEISKLCLTTSAQFQIQ